MDAAARWAKGISLLEYQIRGTEQAAEWIKGFLFTARKQQATARDVFSVSGS